MNDDFGESRARTDGAQLLYLAALGGLGTATGLALDNIGNAYVSGYGSLAVTVDASLAASMYEGDYSSMMGPIWTMKPTIAFAFNEDETFSTSATRWEF